MLRPDVPPRSSDDGRVTPASRRPASIPPPASTGEGPSGVAVDDGGHPHSSRDSTPRVPSEPSARRNASVTKQRLLDAGEREFAARGFAGARLREIAETAGVQPALIHHY